MDGALYGATIPVLKPFGEDSDNLEKLGVNSIAISMHKFFGSSFISGLAISSKEYTDNAFNLRYVGYT